MSRVVVGVLVAALGLASATSAFGADSFGHSPDFRSGYPLDWNDGYEDSLGFEVGLRYGYTQGELHTGAYEGNDSSQSLEAHVRIDDYSTSTYAKGHVGYGVVIEGEYEGPRGSGQYELGRLAFARADLGYNLFQSEAVDLALFAGYDYRNEDADTVGVDLHALRLGASARASFNDIVDISVEVAAVPYAWAKAYGAYGEGYGHLYGGSAEMLLGVQAAPNIYVRGGVRADYLTGPIGFDGEEYETDYFRWGPLVELTYRF